MSNEALAKRLELHVRQLAGYIGERNVQRPKELQRAALYIEEVWKDYGYTVLREEFEADRMDVCNLVVETRPAEDHPFLLIGAHYDSAIGSPGADDNASGIAGLLELAHALKDTPGIPPIRFVAFVNEESPFFGTPLMGSQRHARLSREADENILGMLSLEMLGYYDLRPGNQTYPPLLSPFFPSTGDFIALVADFGSTRFYTRLVDGLKKAGIRLQNARLPRITPGVGLSDHSSFWRNGYPAAMLTDTAMYRNPHYHQASDTPETLDYQRMADLIEGLTATFGAWR